MIGNCEFGLFVSVFECAMSIEMVIWIHESDGFQCPMLD